jgi:hypothetical protein
MAVIEPPKIIPPGRRARRWRQLGGVLQIVLPTPGTADVSVQTAVCPNHVPQVVGGRRQAARFTAVVVAMTLLPLGLGVVKPKGLPALPALQWTMTLDDRSAAAAAAIPGRKVLFVGGSNVRFGVDAVGLSRDLRLPVVNYGLHASLGVDVIAERAAAFVKAGDVVVFAPELSHFRKGSANEYSDDLRIEFLAAHPSPDIDVRLQSFPQLQWRRARSRCNRLRTWAEAGVADAVERALGIGEPRAAAASPYAVEAIGPDGTIVFPRPAAKPIDRWSYSHPPADVAAMSLSPNGSRGGFAFDLLRRTCLTRGATLCVMPPLRVSVDHFDQANMAKMERAWMAYAVAHGATPLLAGGQNVLPTVDGFDTDYHLNDAGEVVARGRLAVALRPIVGDGTAVTTVVR